MTPRERLKYARRRQRILAYTRMLKDKPCMDCRGIFPPVVMQFDHRDPSQKTIRNGHSMSALKSIGKVAKEAAKCDIVCANCHMIRTEKRRLFGYRKEVIQQEQLEFP